MNPSQEELDRWKSKALGVARELDERQVIWERNEKLLARALIRLTLVYEGHRPSCDSQLMQLREVLRKGILDDVRLEKVDALSEAILHEKGADSLQWQTLLLEFLCECAPGPSEQAKLRRLASRKPATPAELKRGLEEVFSAAGAVSWNPLRRWFGRRRDAEPDAAVLQRHLLQLLSEIEIPPELSEQGEQLALTLQQGGVMEKALEGMAQLLGAINSRLRREREEIENFLAQMTGKLQTLEVQSREVSQIFLGSDPSWNEKLSAQVDHLRLQTLRETDLETLKAAVSERLDVLAAQLQAFREAEEHRNSEAEQRIAVLSERLQELEQESEDLRQRLRMAHQQALRDSVTGLPNRQAVDDRLVQEFARWRRFGKPFSLLVWDIDHFKKINDRFGHRAGDKALRVVGHTLADGIRTVDFVGRYGGEEFLMLLPETDGEGALKVAEKLREAVKHCGVNSRGRPVPITISCGLAVVREGDTPQSLFERADEALYQAKQGGRDLCRIA